MKEAKRYENNQPSAHWQVVFWFPVAFWWITEFTPLLPVLVSRRRLCDGGRHGPGQGHAVSSLEGNISAWSQKTVHSRRPLPPLVIYRRGEATYTSKKLKHSILHCAIGFLPGGQQRGGEGLQLRLFQTGAV